MDQHPCGTLPCGAMHSVGRDQQKISVAYLQKTILNKVVPLSADHVVKLKGNVIVHGGHGCLVGVLLDVKVLVSLVDLELHESASLLFFFSCSAIIIKESISKNKSFTEIQSNILQKRARIGNILI